MTSRENDLQPNRRYAPRWLSIISYPTRTHGIVKCEDMISSHVKISIISLISSLSLKLYLNSLVYHRNIFGSFPKVFGNLRTSWKIFGNYRKMFGNVRLAFGTILENFLKSSENHQKRRHQYVYIIKRTLHV